MLRLEGKNAIITGAGRGIGKAIAQKFLQEGANVLICDIDAELMGNAAEKLKQLGNVYTIVGDISDNIFCQALVQKAVALFGEIDVLVNNAGIVVIESFLEHAEASWNKVMDVNLSLIHI